MPETRKCHDCTPGSFSNSWWRFPQLRNALISGMLTAAGCLKVKALGKGRHLPSISVTSAVSMAVLVRLHLSQSRCQIEPMREHR